MPAMPTTDIRIASGLRRAPLCLCLSLALASTLAGPALAQQTTASPPARTSDDGIFSLDRMIVTGAGQAQSQFEASYAITSMTAEQIDKLAPLNLTSLIGSMPGIYAESTGGEVQNVYRIRGIPDEGSFAVIQEDGISPYPDNNGYFYKTEGLVRPDLMVESVETVRGGPSPIFASNAAAIVNFVTRQGGDTPEGAVRTTVGDTGLYRLDGYWSGKLAQDWYLAAGGFVRRNDGYRDVGFPADEGGQFRMHLTHTLDHGKITFTAKHLDDKNAFYMPIPLYDPRDTTRSLDPLIDRFTGTLSAPQLQHATLISSDANGQPQREARDLSDGRHMKFNHLGANLDLAFDNGWSLSNKAVVNRLDMTFDALYSSNAPQNATAYANSRRAAASAAFPGLTRLGYVYTDDGSRFDPASTDGLVIQGQYRAMDVRADSIADDLRLHRSFDWGGDTHDITLGLYGAYYARSYNSRYQSYLFEMRQNPRSIDLLGYDANGAVVGGVTQDGVVIYGADRTQGKAYTSMLAPYIADTWQVTDKLRLEGGVRHERYRYRAWAMARTTGTLGMPDTLADDAARLFTGARTHTALDVGVTNWTAGFNYDLTPIVGVYGRASRAHRAPSEGANEGNVNIPTAEQYELGTKLNFATLDVFATAFYTKYDPYNIGTSAVNPLTGAAESKDYRGSVTNPGVEVAAVWTPAQWLRLDANVTYNDTKVSDLTEVVANGAVAVVDVDGNMPNRQPKLYGNVGPTLLFSTGAFDWETSLRYAYVGKRYADLENTTELAAYHTLAANILVRNGPWDVQLAVDNLTNTFALTEGNPRTDTISGQGTREPIYGRPIYERNTRLVVTYHF
ncbi:TonB-dependent receptor [Xanthomonas campestris pv. raphani]|uniref:TonB-dependent receptor n=2 Tax=Xanthomonas campestris TaxID=339 RepID=UPI0023E9DDED|nr:TonB-dependent receptor [Xanthomonas campestris]MCW1999674.1 outer membrane receptor protein involved in Fe transport [Xanthomonas campestris]MEA9681055.1 TonB-dependent receptor [Xanthomonas campestris pv. raphani]MEA9700980.1 TonB-dependent receptor [Xanthomonas campestris pv. raphani]MEA9781505.1 TonB-dependent receptor [Xanthomonas campestris pv. raphani]MEA9862482.1 TonB-dependent receptor [Xanthomonas campestris pv. raphani]